MGLPLGQLLDSTILGNVGVGKTTFLMQACFQTCHLPETDEWYKKQINVDGTLSYIDIFDMQDDPLRIGTWARNAHSAILMYSVASRSSFENLGAYHDMVMQIKTGSPNFTLMVVGNKCDAGTREVSTEEGRAYAEEIGTGFWEVSSKMGTNVNLMIEDLIRTARTKEAATGKTEKHSRGIASKLMLRLFRKRR